MLPDNTRRDDLLTCAQTITEPALHGPDDAVFFVSTTGCVSVQSLLVTRKQVYIAFPVSPGQRDEVSRFLCYKRRYGLFRLRDDDDDHE